MSNIGVEVQKIRSQSPYKDLRSFASRAGLSHEGLRKIERGERVPGRASLDAILDIGKVPQKKADELRRERDQAQAERDGLALPTYSSEDQLRRIAVRCVHTVEVLFNECDMELGKEEKKILLTRLKDVLRKEICG